MAKTSVSTSATAYVWFSFQQPIIFVLFFATFRIVSLYHLITMSHPTLVFGSSMHLLTARWFVWNYDADTGEVFSLGEYMDQTKSDTGAFDLAHAAASFESPSAMNAILAEKDSEGQTLSPKVRQMLSTLAKDAIRTSETPEQTKSAVTVRHTSFDTVYVVCPAGPA